MSLSRRDRIIINLSQWAFALLLGMVVFILWRTFGPAWLPLKTTTSEYSAIKTHDGTIVVSFYCAGEALTDFEAHVHREAVNTKTGLTVVLPTQMVQFKEGNRSLMRQFYLPSPVPSGEWCVKSKMEWRPLFSLRDREGEAVTKCFEVK